MLLFTTLLLKWNCHIFFCNASCFLLSMFNIHSHCFIFICSLSTYFIYYTLPIFQCKHIFVRGEAYDALKNATMKIKLYPPPLPPKWCPLVTFQLTSGDISLILNNSSCISSRWDGRANPYCSVWHRKASWFNLERFNKVEKSCLRSE